MVVFFYFLIVEFGFSTVTDIWQRKFYFRPDTWCHKKRIFLSTLIVPKISGTAVELITTLPKTELLF